MESITCIAVIMLDIYIFTVGVHVAILRKLISGYIIQFIAYVIILSFNCLIHGLVYDENENMFIGLDELDISHNKLENNIEALYFMTQTIDAKFGFTIAGNIAFRKTTLLSVKFNSFKCIF